MIESNESLIAVANHRCLRCGKAVDRVVFRASTSGGGTYHARCHGMVTQRTVTAIEIEDARQLEYFTAPTPIDALTLKEGEAMIFGILAALGGLVDKQLVTPTALVPQLTRRGREYWDRKRKENSDGAIDQD